MDKLLVLQSEERQDEERFRETMAIRDHILEAKQEIESMEKRSQKIRQEISVMEASSLQIEMDIKMLEAETDQIKKNVEEKADRVLKSEDKVKTMKSSFQTFLRDKIEKCNEILKQNQENNNNFNCSITSKKPPQNSEELMKVWSMEGEIEALTLIKEYMVNKVEEINIMREIIDPFVQELEQNNANNNILDTNS